jgi:ABC-type phosphonate transport system ATPase subunit
MTQSGVPVIRVADLKKHYGDVKAVDGVTFEVERGEVFGMLGPNGARPIRALSRSWAWTSVVTRSRSRSGSASSSRASRSTRASR